MNPPTERHVSIVLPAHVEPVWIRELGWVPVGRGPHHYDGLPLSETPPPELHVFD